MSAVIPIKDVEYEQPDRRRVQHPARVGARAAGADRRPSAPS